MVCLYARSPRGTRAYGTIPCSHWTWLTVLGVLGTEGILAAMSIEAATDADVFCAFLDQVLLPALRQHKTPRIETVPDRVTVTVARLKSVVRKRGNGRI